MKKILLMIGILISAVSMLTSCSEEMPTPTPPEFYSIFKYGEYTEYVSDHEVTVDIVVDDNLADNAKLKYMGDNLLVTKERINYFVTGDVGGMPMEDYFSHVCHFVDVEDYLHSVGNVALPDNGATTIPVDTYAVRYYVSDDDGKRHIEVKCADIGNRIYRFLTLIFCDDDMEMGVIYVSQGYSNSLQQ